MTKILLVEDDKSLREIYGVRLLAEGYDIVSAGDGEEALAMAIKERPQLIVSDVMMPKISGFDMLDILRSTTETRDIKVIMMTALSSEDQRARGEALGADRYLVKSQVGIEDVVRTVHEVLGDAPVVATATPAFGTPMPSAGMRPVGPMTAPQRPQSAPTYNPAATPAPQQPQPQAIPQPVQPQPAPQPQYMQQPPAATPQQPAPQQPQPIQQPQAYAQPAPAASNLPQPTAPFSTPRPANLGDRIIHPIQQEARSGPDLGSLIDQELGRTPEPTQAPQISEADALSQLAASQPQPAVQPQEPQAATPQPHQPPTVQPQQQPEYAPQPTPQPAPQFQMPQPPAPQFEMPSQPTQAPQSPTTPPDSPFAGLHGASDITFEETPRQPQPAAQQPPVN